ncbi:Biotin synthesis protein bioC / Dethiobiotin synthetase [Achromobacter xylosoxidans NBRC 15126 = ATCC 27061]|nr:dethiobiotin synthase [Achromobacter xylosoxidans]AHC49049.1 Biotin synthesis protein bioC / Dethiobiotin synthetase [Achromobacter xylosoxidans NBRC 15126 = ATCC 27061]CKH98237.1 ATP-dependent dethiobiotin synthetase BioD [Achromobacter xylosoxidans]SQG76720.1 ATP-dependent dethiobiotin synthetase BioD [Achromobacter xylosoxidans]
MTDSPAHGVFVTGTDTGIGKTLVSAILARAWQADYWKPVQTGVAEEPGDTDTVARLAQLPPERLHLPAYVLQAPLSPWAAAPLEDAVIDATAIVPPATTAPLIVEGAGGLYVPIDDSHMMIDLIARLGMPVVLAARSGLGTINHTLLSLEALRRRAIPVLGVIMSGPLSAGNREAIERFGNVRVLAEIPPLERVDAAAVEALARTVPPLAECLAAMRAAD